jgi:hypothetical protein
MKYLRTILLAAFVVLGVRCGGAEDGAGEAFEKSSQPLSTPEMSAASSVENNCCAQSTSSNESVLFDAPQGKCTCKDGGEVRPAAKVQPACITVGWCSFVPSRCCSGVCVRGVCLPPGS